jgi:hypothetical protein
VPAHYDASSERGTSSSPTTDALNMILAANRQVAFQFTHALPNRIHCIPNQYLSINSLLTASSVRGGCFLACTCQCTCQLQGSTLKPYALPARLPETSHYCCEHQAHSCHSALAWGRCAVMIGFDSSFHCSWYFLLPDETDALLRLSFRRAAFTSTEQCHRYAESF